MAGTVYIGRYKVIEEVGRGGMGIVYRGEDPVLARPVAIKVLPPKKTAHKKAVQRFLREARVSARLDHPNIVKVYDVGEEDNIYHIVMEYVDGRGLRDILDEIDSVRKVNIREMAKLFRQICSAMGYAHELKIVHRDIKPENVKVNDSWRAKVMDFGLAVLEDRHSITEAGAVMGTIAYFSPEQARGDAADFRADIYSCGMVFYEMLTLALPFEATSLPDMINKHLTAAPVPPSLKNPEIPDALNKFILRCLEKDPANRFQSAYEMEEYISAWLAGSALPTHREAEKKGADLLQDLKAELLSQLKQVADEEKMAVPAEPETSEPSPPEEEKIETPPELPEETAPSAGEAPEPEEAGGGEDALGDAVFQLEEELDSGTFIQEDLTEEAAGDDYAEDFEYLEDHEKPLRHSEADGGIGNVPAVPRQSEQKLVSDNWLDKDSTTHKKAYREFIEKMKRDAENTATLAEMPESLLCGSCGQENPLGSRVCTRCGNALESVSRLGSREALYYNDRGVEFLETGDLKQAMEMFEKALAFEPRLFEANCNLAKVNIDLGNLDDALKLVETCFTLDGSSYIPYVLMADIYRLKDEKIAAVEEYVKALHLEPNDASVRCRLAFLYTQLGYAAKAVTEYRYAAAIEPDNMEAHRQLGYLYAGLEQIDDAIRELETVVRLDPGNQKAYGMLGDLYKKKRRFGQAEKHYSAALTLDPDDSSIYSSLGDMYVKQKRDDMAFQTLSRAVDIEYGNKDARLQLADMYLRHRSVDKAIYELEEIVNTHPGENQVHQKLGELYMGMEQYDKALEHYEKSVGSDTSADVHNRLGMLYMKKDYASLGVMEYKKAVTLQPYNAEFREDLGMAYYCQGQKDMAIEEIRKAVTLDSRNVDYFKALGVMLEEEGRCDEAIKMLSKARELSPRDSMVPALIGKVYFTQGLVSLALVEYQKALELQPTNYLFCIYIAKAYIKKGQPDRAIEYFKRALSLMPDKPGGVYNDVMSRAYLDLGKSHIQKGELSQARDVLMSAWSMTPENAAIAHQLGVANLGLNNFKEAFRYLSKAITMSPDNLDLLIDLARCYARMGDYEMAYRACLRAIELDPSRLDFIGSMTDILMSASRFTDARDFLDRRIQMDPQNGPYYHWLKAKIFLRRKDHLSAEKEFVMAVDGDPENYEYFVDFARFLRSRKRYGEAIDYMEGALSLLAGGVLREQLLDELDELLNLAG